jgi:mono/diheme cytochrome c family protein
MRMIRDRFIFSLAVFSLSAFSTAQAQTPSAGATLFEKKCYSCHNIGGGDKKGPDLKGATLRRPRAWLHEFIKTPATMNRQGDAEAAALFKKFAPEVMPDQDLTDEQIETVLALIEGLAKKNETFVPAGAKLARPVVTADIWAGLNLFTGQTALTSGGPSCISCHNVKGVGALGGGTLGPDLTAVNTKYRDPELISILQNPNFPTMKAAFAARPLTDEEIVQLFGYLQNAKKAHPAAQGTPGVVRIEPWFLVIGAATLVLALVGLNVTWKDRLRGVRDELIRRNSL